MAKGARHDLKGKGKARERTYGKARDRTRGDKPRLIEDPELEERVLSSQLKEAGLYAANILGDGNCLFRALSDQLYGSPSMHQAIRQEICDYLAGHPDKYRLFVDEDSVKGGFDGHVREMRQNGTYGTNIELSAFVARYRRPVKVYQPNLVYVLPVEDKGPSATASSSSPPPPPAPPLAQDGDCDKLTARERRLKARQDKVDAKGKGKGKQRAAAAAATGAKVDPAAPSSASAAGPFDDSPLCIVYHSWEHYSSLRNISGPHTGPPRLRVGRVNSPAVNNDGAAASSEALEEDESAEREPARDVEEGEEEDKVEQEQERDEDVTMDESQDTVAPPRRTPRGSPPTDHPLPAIRTALARARSSADGSVKSSGVLPQPTIPVFPPSDSSASPSSPPSSSASSPPPSGSADSTTRPPKHLLDRSLSQPRSYSPLSISSSSSVAPPATSDHDDAELDANDNDRAGPRTRSRLASPASGSQRSARSAASSSSSGTSTGVASSAAVAEDDEDASESSSRASPGAAPSPPPPPPAAATRGKGRGRAVPSPRERRGPTSSEKKELARVRRLERRRAKGVGAQPVAGRGGDEGRVLRSGRRTSGAGAPAQQQQGDAGLGKVRELFI
ncbi:hypothetical protein JCM8208_004176 [Rhodotorula glutinis]